MLPGAPRGSRSSEYRPIQNWNQNLLDVQEELNSDQEDEDEFVPSKKELQSSSDEEDEVEEEEAGLDSDVEPGLVLLARSRKNMLLSPNAEEDHPEHAADPPPRHAQHPQQVRASPTAHQRSGRGQNQIPIRISPSNIFWILEQLLEEQELQSRVLQVRRFKHSVLN
ncbi:hypothetical protein CRENBAI_015527 [Crenichthys baileyi]|uniref:Uncharacterized protein n=1 Tax=Crenichthys baileyi TaxID=28760 RepID=A0AAV9SE55_9TELE